jgi:hypothetical protein
MKIVKHCPVCTNRLDLLLFFKRHRVECDKCSTSLIKKNNKSILFTIVTPMYLLGFYLALWPKNGWGIFLVICSWIVADLSSRYEKAR